LENQRLELQPTLQQAATMSISSQVRQHNEGHMIFMSKIKTKHNVEKRHVKAFSTADSASSLELASDPWKESNEDENKTSVTRASAATKP
jgi:hypothetical protein